MSPLPLSKSLMLAFTLLLAAAPVGAEEAPKAPSPEKAGDLTYITGGYGIFEREAMKALVEKEKGYELQLINANEGKHLTAGTDIVILDGKGQEIANLKDTGPLLYAKLKEGQYTLKAKNGEQEQARKISVTPHRGAYVVLIWN